MSIKIQSYTLEPEMLAEVPDLPLPSGFAFAACQLGIKDPRPDCAVIVSDPPAICQAMLTTNAVKAAPVLRMADQLAQGGDHMGQVVLINSGNANACTGEAGRRAVNESVRVAAHTFGCPPKQVWTMSTGVIGRPLPEQIFAGVAQAKPAATPAAFAAASRAIMTTDTRAKGAAVEIMLSGGKVRLAGMAKGSGMIDPALATMLVWLGTDARLESVEAGHLLHDAVDHSFHCISVDGDQSTNDTVLLQANGASGCTLMTDVDRALFARALQDLCQTLAIALVDDGEGTTHLIDLSVTGAQDEISARRIARKIAGSSLVKTAIFGHDPNWGRIAAAVGAVEPKLDPERLQVHICGVSVFAHGQPAPETTLREVSHGMQQRTIPVVVDLGMGEGETRFWSSDLTYEYIRINAEYTT